jgi:hypothetical protein
MATKRQLVEALTDLVQAFDVKMGKSAVTVRIEIARDLLKSEGKR